MYDASRLGHRTEREAAGEAAPREGERLSPAEIALQLQRASGNRAVARILARDTATAAPASQSAKPALKTGKELDEMLLASSFFEPYIRPKIAKGTKAEGHVHIHDPDTFKAEAIKYLLGKEHPKTHEVFTAETAEQFEPTLHAFQDDKGEVRLQEKRVNDGTIVHEAMHLFSSVAFVDAVGYHVNEGVTEVFARRLASENGILRAGFPTQHRLVVQVMTAAGPGATGEKLLADAYFKDERQPLIDAVDKKKGAGTWERWLSAMNDGKFEEADEIV
jgi:hypothetical protein